MKRLFARLAAFVGSLAGRLVLILTVGIAAAAIISLLAAEHARVHDFKRVQLDRVVASTVDMASRFARDPVRTHDLLYDHRILGARDAPIEWRTMTPDANLGRLLAAQLGARADARAMQMPHGSCFPNFDSFIRVAGMNDNMLPDCWFVLFRDTGGTERRMSIDLAPFRIPPSSTLDPVYLLLIVAASLALSMIVARFATAPLRRLTSAARAFSVTVDPEPIPEDGPREVRVALETFNVMQHRVREGFRERTQILASVAHDLQTPLTRLRLRLEQVADETLRERLISDLAATQRLVRDGLELARSSESREPWSIVDIDSILSSVAEDAAEFGADVRFVSGCGARTRVKPNALGRCVSNLVDNAIKYAGDAELSCGLVGSDLVISVRDHGPGLPPAALNEAFEPFRRFQGERSPSHGSGLGLTIARAQAHTFGAHLSLHNHENGGLVAHISLRIM
ncbi:ATP-binding protein [Sphingomonas abietis]|uniref:histidine kinase n=1 Tax=Sphingomonas abietis TaxID=3012344 RepID=A0ABY7NQG9_9SPHN|nr:ATP-binding protein [Sphingomonas abietis]WBO23794.1 ATP-binding protein [Sphingomonas abietis]